MSKSIAGANPHTVRLLDLDGKFEDYALVRDYRTGVNLLYVDEFVYWRIKADLHRDSVPTFRQVPDALVGERKETRAMPI